jgi:hypothetical protein
VSHAISLAIATLALIAFVLAFPNYARSDSPTGSISGIVTDAQGGVIPNADVTATNIQTGVAAKTKTNEAGVYNVPYLKPGTYEVRIGASGLKEAVITGVLVDVGNIARVDVTLQMGAITQSITVQDSVPLLEQETPTYDAQVNRKFVEDLPQAVSGGTRDASTLVNLVPGAQTPGASSGESYGSQFGVNIGGGRQFTAEWQVDGMNMAYQGVTSDVSLDNRPDLDIVSEVKVDLGVPAAEYGRTSGGVVSYITRSGSNALHGNLTGFVRNTVLDARPYNAATVPRDQQWEMADSIGGPVLIPHVYNGRNKTFFFFNLTTFRQPPTANPGTVTVPTAQERTGDFSDFPEPIFDPTTGQQFQYQGKLNVIPPNRIGATATFLNSKVYPAPTSAGVLVNGFVVNNYTGTTPGFNKQTDWFLRIDQNFGSNNRVGGSFRARATPALLAESGPFGDALSGNSTPRGISQFTVWDDWVINPHLVNHFAASEVGFHITQNSEPLNPADWPSISGTYAPAFPSFCFGTNGYQGMGLGLGGGNGCSVGQVNYEKDRSRDVQDSIAWVKGKHSLKFGARYLWFQAATGEYDSRSGIYQFSDAETAQVVNGATVAGTGNSYASFLLGLVNASYMQDNPAPDQHIESEGFYAQDDFKISKKLTLNYGLRWDYQGMEWEQNNQMAEMSPTTPNPGAGGLLGAYIFARQKGVRNFVNNWHKAFSPRIGGAYSVTPTLVVRASMGIILAPPTEDVGGGVLDEAGYGAAISVNSPNGGVTPAMNWDVGWTKVPHPPDFDPAIYNGTGANTDAGNADRWPESYIWQLDVQKSFARNYMVSAGYIGQSSHHLLAGLALPNQVNPKYLSLGPLLTDSITDPAVVAAGFTPPYASFAADWGGSATLAQALKLYPQFYSVNVLNNHLGNSTYNALLLKVEKRFSNGFQFLTSFTASKTISDATLNAFGIAGPQDTYNRGVEKSVAPLDLPRALDVSATYQLPWGPGRPFLKHGYLSQILGGWALAGILDYTSGTPISVGAPDTLPIANGHLDSDYLGGPISNGIGRGQTIIANSLGPGQAGTVVVNRAAFGFPAPFTFGNTYVVPNVRTLGFQSENLSLFKRETFRERYQVELRLDAFNAFNRKVPGYLVTDLTNPDFGQYTGSTIGPRGCQVGLRITF